jgi:hypothetical protein
MIWHPPPPQNFWWHVLIRSLGDDEVQFTILNFNIARALKNLFSAGVDSVEVTTTSPNFDTLKDLQM